MNLRRARMIVLAVFVLWAGLSFMTPVGNFDLWTNFKLGEDLLAGGGIPTVEPYSATAEGRPFVAFEWLSAVILASIHDHTDNYGLVALRTVVGLACLGLLYLSLPAVSRVRAPVLLFLVLATYLLCFRAILRPHLFSLLAVSVVVFSIERWRRSRRLADLIWLIPLFTVWANLHGAYLLGLVLLGVVSATALIGAALPAWIRDAGRTFSRSEGLGVGAVALAGFGACFVNPYGSELVEFSFGMTASNEYIKAVVWEWMSPFKTGPGNLWFAIYCATMILLWASVIARLRDRPWLDFAFAVVVTGLTVRANRFVPYAAIIGFPIGLRGVQSLWERGIGRDREWPSRGLYAVLLLLMLGTSVGPASRFSPRGLRPLGFGNSPGHPYEEVAYIEDRGLEGVIFNEYGDGGLIIHALHPIVRPVMDPRIDIYGAELFSEWRYATATPKHFEAYLEKYDVKLVLIFPVPRNQKILAYLRRNRDWLFEKNFPDRVLFRLRSSSGDPIPTNR